VAHCFAVVWQLLALIVNQPHVTKQVRPALALLRQQSTVQQEYTSLWLTKQQRTKWLLF
jgi:hypothetical protein